MDSVRLLVPARPPGLSISAPQSRARHGSTPLSTTGRSSTVPSSRTGVDGIAPKPARCESVTPNTSMKVLRRTCHRRGPNASSVTSMTALSELRRTNHLCTAQSADSGTSRARNGSVARRGVLRSCRRCRSGPQRASRGERLFGTRHPEPAGHARDFSLAAVSCLSSRPTELRAPTSALSAALRYWPHTTGNCSRSTRVARLAQQFHLEGPHHRWVAHDLDLGDSVTDDAEGEHRTEAPAGSPNRSGSTVDERHLCVCGPPR